MDNISKQCAEGLIDMATTIGIAQGVAASEGIIDIESLDEIRKSAEELPGKQCPFTEEATEALGILVEKCREIAEREPDEAGMLEVTEDDREQIQDNLNRLIEKVLA